MIAKVVRSEDGLSIGEEYVVDGISMGQSYTYITLMNPKQGTKNPFNSVIFDFYEDGKKINIYKDKRYNPYL